MVLVRSISDTNQPQVHFPGFKNQHKCRFSICFKLSSEVEQRRARPWYITIPSHQR